MSKIFIEAFDPETGDNYNNNNESKIFIEAFDPETGDNYNNVIKHNITTLVEGVTGVYVDLNEAEDELLSNISNNVDTLHEEFIDTCIEIGSGERELNELSAYDVKDKLKKAWKAIVDFFKRVIIYIQKKIKGQVDNLSVEHDKDAREIVFYAKAKKVKKIEYDSSDKFNVIDVESCFTILNLAVFVVDNSKFEDVEKNIKPDDQASRAEIEVFKAEKEKLKSNGMTGETWSEIIQSTKAKRIDPNKLDDYITKINKYYQKAIDAIHKVGKSAIKRAKKTPNREVYKIYLNAKSISSMCLNVNTLIKINDDSKK